MPLAVFAAIGFAVSVVMFFAAWMFLTHGDQFIGKRALLFIIPVAGFGLMMAMTLKQVKHYPSQTVVLKSATTVEQLCHRMRPAWYVHTCRQQIYADNQGLVGLRVLRSGTRLFVNGDNYFQWNV